LPVEEVLLEMRPSNPRSTLLELEQRGYTVHQPLSSLFSGDLNPYFGRVHACAKQDDGWRGAADPRRDGAVTYAGIKGAANQEAIKPLNP
jgi:gamma-glutamyltranspeptidase